MGPPHEGPAPGARLGSGVRGASGTLPLQPREGPSFAGHPGHPGATQAGPTSCSSRGRCPSPGSGGAQAHAAPRCTAWLEPSAQGALPRRRLALCSAGSGQRGARSPPAPSQSPRPSCSAAAGSRVPAASPPQHHPERRPVAPSPSPRGLRCGWRRPEPGGWRGVLGAAFLAERPPFPPWEPGPSSPGSLTSAFSPLPGSGTLGGDHPQSHLEALRGRRPASACLRGLFAPGPGTGSPPFSLRQGAETEAPRLQGSWIETPAPGPATRLRRRDIAPWTISAAADSAGRQAAQ